MEKKKWNMKWNVNKRTLVIVTPIARVPILGGCATKIPSRDTENREGGPLRIRHSRVDLVCLHGASINRRPQHRSQLNADSQETGQFFSNPQFLLPAAALWKHQGFRHCLVEATTYGNCNCSMANS